MVLAKQYLCVPEKITSLNAEPLLLTEEMSHNQKKKKKKENYFIFSAATSISVNNCVIFRCVSGFIQNPDRRTSRLQQPLKNTILGTFASQMRSAKSRHLPVRMIHLQDV